MRKTMQFIPTSSPRMIQNSFIFGADSIIFDLEDAVSIDEKDTSRDLLEEALNFFEFKNCEVVVRINPLYTKFAKEDIKMLKETNIDAIMLPMATIDGIEQLALQLINTNIKIIALIETALGVEEAFKIASHKFVNGILLGAEDLAVDLGVERTKSNNEILYARGRIINACKACKIDAIDTPYTNTIDIDGLRQDTLFAKSIGFDGKATINPRQIIEIKNIFLPSKDEIKYAKLVLEETEKAKKEGLGVFSLYGKMIDKPIIERAKNTIKIAKKAGIYYV